MDSRPLLDPVCSQIAQMEASKKILLLDNLQPRESGMGTFSRYKARKGKGPEVNLALEAVRYLERTLDISLPDRQCVSIRRAQGYITSYTQNPVYGPSSQPPYPVEPLPLGKAQARTVNIEGENDHSQGSQAGKFAGVVAIERQCSKTSSAEATKREDGIEVAPKKPNRKKCNVHFKEAVTQIFFERSEYEKYEVMVNEVLGAEDFQDALEALVWELPPEEMAQFREYVFATYSSEERRQHFDTFLSRTAVLIPLVVVTEELLTVPEEEIRYATNCYMSDAQYWRKIITNTRWLHHHLKGENIDEVIKSLMKYITDNPNYFSEHHADKSAEHKETLEQHGVPLRIKERMTFHEDGPELQAEFREARRLLAFDQDTKGTLLEGYGLAHLKGNGNVYSVMQTMALAIKAPIISS